MKPRFGLLICICIACNNPTPAPATTTFTNTIDTTAVQEIVPSDVGIPTSFVPGYYTGLLPCADCRNIQRRILFLHNHSFHLMDEHIDATTATAPVEMEGQWQATNDELQLLASNAAVKRFMVTNKGLVEVNISGSPVIRSTDTYLTRSSLSDDNKEWMEKKQAGVDFLALGNEPFWLLEIDKEKQISFTLADSSEHAVFPYAAPTPQNGQWTYTLHSDTASMQITIIEQFCSDGMSDNWYEYGVEANYRGTIYHGCGVKLNNWPH